MNVLTAVIFGTWIICSGAIGVRADTDTPTRDTVIEEAVSAAADTSVAPMSDSTRIEASVLLAGRWRVAEATDEEKQRLKAIDQVTDRLGRFKRGKARSRLAERTVPPSSLMIEVTDSKVTIVSGDRRLELELEGSPVEVTRSEGTTQMNAKMEGERLVVLSRGDKGGRTVTYKADGDSLSRKVTMTSDQIAAPLKYVTTYARVE